MSLANDADSSPRISEMCDLSFCGSRKLAPPENNLVVSIMKTRQ